MKKISIAVLLSTAVISSAAFASDQGFYIGANVGQAKLSTTAQINPATTSTTDYSVLGGYQINKNFAVEAQYISLGNFSDKGISHTANGYAATAVGILPFNDQWSAYAKLGYANTTLGNSGNNQTGNTSRNAVTYGAGAQYNVNQQLGVRLGYDNYGVAAGSGGNQTTTIGVISAGVVYKF